MSVEDKLNELAILAEAMKDAKEKEKNSDIETDDEDQDDDTEDQDDTDDEDAKPDFLDVDKDGDKEEDMVKALKTKKKVVKESVDLGNLFEGQNLSEEFKSNATEIFESAVNMRVAQELEDKIDYLQENFYTYADEESAGLKESLVDKIDGYLDYMVEQWMVENELAIERGIKAEIFESFMSGMKGVFESHYINVPEEKYDLVEEAQAEVEKLEKRLDEVTAKNVELVQGMKEIARTVAIEEACSDMVATDAEKFKMLAEELSYSEDTFESKLNLIKESYFSENAHKTSLNEEFMTDSPVEELVEETNVSSDMQKYLTAIERTSY